MAALVKFSRTLPVLRQVTRINRSLSYLSTTVKLNRITVSKPELLQRNNKNSTGTSIRKASAAVPAETSQYDGGRDQFRRQSVSTQNLFEWTSNNIDMSLTRYQRVNKRQFDILVVEAEKLGFKVAREKCLLMLKCTGDSMIDVDAAERTKLTDMLWSKMKENDVPIDHVYYNFLLSAHLQNGRKFSPTDILAEMHEQELTPNRVTYQRFIASYCQNGDIPGATQILDHMKNQGMPVSADAFHSFITGHIKAGDKESAKNVLTIISEVGLEVTSESYSALLVGLAESKDYEGVKEALKQCESEGILLKSHHIVELIVTFLQNGYTELNQELLGMLSNMRRFSNQAINQINQLFVHGFDDMAYEIYCIMPKDSSVQQTEASNRFFLRFIARNSRPVEKVHEILTDMKNRGFSKDDIREVAHLAYLEYNPDYALKILEKCAIEGLEIPPHCYLPALCQYKDLKDKNKIIEVMKTINTYDSSVANLASVMLDYWIPALRAVGENTESIVSISREIGIEEGEINFAFGIHTVLTKGFKAAVEYVSDKQLLVNTGAVRQGLERALPSDPSWSDAIKFLQICQNNISLNIIGGTKIILRNMLKFGSSSGDWAKAEEFLDTTFDIPRDDMRFIEMMQEFRNAPTSIREKLLMKVTDNMRQPLNEDDFSDVNSKAFSPFSLRRLAITHAKDSKDLEKASQYISMLSTQYPEFPYYELVLLDVVILGLEHGKVQESIELLKHYSTKHSAYMKLKNYSNNYRLQGKCQEITTMATSKCPDMANQVIDTLVTSGYINPKCYSLLAGHAQLVLKQENDDDVLKGLGEMVDKNQTVSLLPEFMARFIQKEDPERLQKVMDMTLSVMGEKEVLSNLVVTFMTCGHPKKAMKVFETPGVWLGQRVCDLFVFGGHTAALEQFVNYNRDTDQNFREELLFTLIRSYAKSNEPSKALDVLVQYEEENITPRPRTLRFLAKVLEGAGLTVPYTVPQIEDGINPTQKSSQPKQTKPQTVIAAGPVLQFPQVVELSEEVNIDNIVAALSKLTTETDVATFLSELLGQLHKNKKSKDVRDLFKRFDADGNTDVLQTITNTTMDLPSQFRNNAKKDYLIALVNKGSIEELEKLLESNVSDLGQYLTQIAMTKLQEEHPSTFLKVEALAERSMTEFGKKTGLQQMFASYCKVDSPKAVELLEKYPDMIVREDIVKLCSWARAQKNDELTLKIAELMKNYNKGYLALVYSYTLDIYSHVQHFDKALDMIKTIESNGITLKDIHELSITRLETALTEGGRSIPWKSNADSSSSSDSDSSDDEKKEKR